MLVLNMTPIVMPQITVTSLIRQMLKITSKDVLSRFIVSTDSFLPMNCIDLITSIIESAVYNKLKGKGDKC